MNDRATNEYAETSRPLDADSTQRDYRQVIVELLRILVSRRWFFYIPCCIGLTGAFLFTHHIPRRYIARTIFERQDDPVIASVVQSDLQPSFETMRRSMTLDLKGREAIHQAVRNSQWAARLPNDDSGNLTAAGKREINALAADIDKNIRLRMLERSKNLDVVELAYAGEDPHVTAEIVNLLRDNYIVRAQERLQKLMTESRDFFRIKVKEDREKLATIRDVMQRLTDDLPERVDLARPESLSRQISAVRTEQEQLEQKLEELLAKIEARENFLEDPRRINPVLNEKINPELAAAGDPEVIRLRNELTQAEDRIKSLRTDHRMKELHPVMQQYLRERDRLVASVADAKRQAVERLRAGNVGVPAGIKNDSLTASTRQIMMELEALKRLLKLNEKSAQRIAGKLSSLEKSRTAFNEQHRKYLALQKDGQDVQASLVIWQNNLASVSRWFDVGGTEKGSAFRIIEPARPTKKPYSPRSTTVLIFCTLLGLLIGAAGVLLAELVDPTLRTANQVSRVLGIPIIEGVSEIVTPGGRSAAIPAPRGVSTGAGGRHAADRLRRGHDGVPQHQQAHTVRPTEKPTRGGLVLADQPVRRGWLGGSMGRVAEALARSDQADYLPRVRDPDPGCFVPVDRQGRPAPYVLA